MFVCRYLTTGSTFTDLHYYYRLGISTIRKIVLEVCQQIWNKLKDEYLHEPSRQEWVDIATNYENNSHFPHCIGSVDGKHIRVQKFRRSGSMNLNYKHFFSIVLMAIADSDYKFIYVDVGAYGKDCDSSVFKETVFWRKLCDGSLDIPKPSKTHPMYSEDMPYVLVADEAFALHDNLLRPFGGHNLSVKKRIFNYRLSRARRYVECTFGILSNKWRIFHRSLNVSKSFAKEIVKACVVLHNIVRIKDGFRSEDIYVSSNNEFHDLLPRNIPRGGRYANNIRESFANYFVTPMGAISWQMSKI